MNIHTCSNSVTCGRIPYCGKKLSTAETEYLWIFYLNMNRGKCILQWIKVPELYFTQQRDYYAMLISRFVYTLFGLQIFVCRPSHCQHLMTALDNTQIKTVAQCYEIVFVVTL
jgi:hypothetical protein